MRTPYLPPTRANVAAASGEWCALFDCLDCADGVYTLTGSCSCCGATAPASILKVMHDLRGKNQPAVAVAA